MKAISRILFIFSLSLVFSIQYFGQQTASIISILENIEESVKLAPCKQDERLAAVKKLFSQSSAKAEEITIEKFNKDKISNLVVIKKGKSDEIIIIGAHYDKTDDGCGAIDNWTGIVILANLYSTISQTSTEKSYVFVAFDQEEKGLLGSKAMAKAIPKEKRLQYCAMVNLDSFGLGSPQSFRETSDSEMVSIAKAVSKETKIPFADVSIAGADADSASFKSRDIPSITLHGLNSNWKNYLHSKSDMTKNINFVSVYIGYRFALSFIAKLDTTACKDLR